MMRGIHKEGLLLVAGRFPQSSIDRTWNSRFPLLLIRGTVHHLACRHVAQEPGIGQHTCAHFEAIEFVVPFDRQERIARHSLNRFVVEQLSHFCQASLAANGLRIDVHL